VQHLSLIGVDEETRLTVAPTDAGRHDLVAAPTERTDELIAGAPKNPGNGAARSVTRKLVVVRRKVVAIAVEVRLQELRACRPGRAAGEGQSECEPQAPIAP
jgi:hypothetical protein